MNICVWLFENLFCCDNIGLNSKREKNMKVLILSCNLGEGHNSAAKAIKEQFDKQGIYCEIQNSIAFLSKKVSDLIGKIYVYLALNTPNVYGNMYNSGKKIRAKKKPKSFSYVANTLYSKKLSNFISENGFDQIIMVHVYPSQAVTHLRKHNLIDTNAQVYTVSTDYSFCPYFEELKVDQYFIPHKDVMPEFTIRGIKEEQLTVTGIPTSERFMQRTPKYEAREKLNLPLDKKIVMIMTGSMGFGNTSEIAEYLNQNDPEIMQIIFGGNNEEAKASLREKFKYNRNVRVLDFTTEVPLYMDACDLLFTKPGGLSSTEACIKGIPLVHTAPIPGNETENIEFFKAHGLSVAEEKPADAAEAAIRLLRNNDAVVAMKQAQETEIIRNSAEIICNYVIEHEKGKNI